MAGDTAHTPNPIAIKAGAKPNMAVLHLSSPVQSAQPHHAVAQAVRWGVVCRTLASNDVMAITKCSISGSEKSVPAKHQQSKMRGYSL